MLHIHPSFMFSALTGLKCFLMIVSAISLHNVKSLFLESHGSSHRRSGAALLLWLLVGATMTTTTSSVDHHNNHHHHRLWLCFYDVVLGCLGILVTWTAAQDFPHKHIRNANGQSGPLSLTATVSQSEMIEHIFYQGLNLLQAMYLHFMSYCYQSNNYAWITTTTTTTNSMSSCFFRLSALFVVTSPWLMRRRFPVHSFSANWKLASESMRKTESTELWLYRIKKVQYIFYKHVIFHGLNMSMAIDPVRVSNHLPWSSNWRVFWLALNTSYVMEFFLQTLVKRQRLSQYHMLWLQRLLMFASSWAALHAVRPVVVPIIYLCLLSVILNVIRRQHDCLHTMLLASSYIMWQVLATSERGISFMKEHETKTKRFQNSAGPFWA